MPHPAKVVGGADLSRLLAFIQTHRHPLRDRAIVLLSFKAGLRACEIAGLSWSMTLAANGKVADQLLVASTIAKNGQRRSIPLHPELRAALVALHRGSGRPRDGPVVASERGGHMTARSIVNWFARAYAALGLDGCSSHSGRRTFITRSARLVTRAGGSLRDIQQLVGHADLATTQRYIDGDSDAQRKLIRLI
ncbi:tyrosine-type recombinase/integrase [Sphingomonas sp.]|uniref:tyrosine-type recombinase/integrase n=1 Tax=Sphingomonas sp. TaxID=28214 RepID=UPI0035C7DB29